MTNRRHIRGRLNPSWPSPHQKDERRPRRRELEPKCSGLQFVNATGDERHPGSTGGHFPQMRSHTRSMATDRLECSALRARRCSFARASSSSTIAGKNRKTHQRTIVTKRIESQVGEYDLTFSQGPNIDPSTCLPDDCVSRRSSWAVGRPLFVLTMRCLGRANSPNADPTAATPFVVGLWTATRVPCLLKRLSHC